MQWELAESPTNGTKQSGPRTPAPADKADAHPLSEVFALQRAAGNRAVSTLLSRSVDEPTVRGVAESASAPLPQRDRLQLSLGVSLDDVRVDLGSPAARTALAGERAVAATVGSRILFDTATPTLRTVAHETAHVAQQRSAGKTVSAVHAESEAHEAAQAVEAGKSVRLAHSVPTGRPQFLTWANGVTAPTISHDHGFLDDGSGNLDLSRMREPGVSDYASLVAWRAKLAVAQNVMPDLVDGTRAYEHFLDGNGADYTVEYDRFLAFDGAGRTILANAIRDVSQGARTLDNEWLAAHGESPVPNHAFTMASDAIPVGGGNADYPYPTTENWQKAIGAHMMWLSADVEVTVDDAAGTRSMSIELTLHMEDRYNFNPGAADIATGAPDAANGRFELTGLGHEFMQYGTASRLVMLPAEALFTPGGASGEDVMAPVRPPGPPARDDRE